MPLETELSRALKQIVNPRNRRLVARHLGWDGGLPCSLNKVAKEYDLTRERARQIYAAALPVLRQCHSLPTLDAVLRFIATRTYELAITVEIDLKNRGLTRTRFPLSSVLRAAHVFGRSPRLQLHQFGGVIFVGDVSQLARELLIRAAKTVSHDGAARVSDLRRALSASPRGIVDVQLVRRILQTRPDICWLDDVREWFCLTSITRNRLLSRVQKVLAVRSRIHISALHRAVLKAYRPLRIPAPILRSFCARLSWCDVDSRYVQARIAPKAKAVLTGGEAILYKILEDHGGRLPLGELQQLCFRAGLARANLWRLLSFSPLVRRTSRETYGLIVTHPRPRPSPHF